MELCINKVTLSYPILFPKFFSKQNVLIRIDSPGTGIAYDDDDDDDDDDDYGSYTL